MEKNTKAYITDLLEWSYAVEELLHRNDDQRQELSGWDDWKIQLEDGLREQSLSEKETLYLRDEAQRFALRLEQELNNGAVPIGKHKLPPLPYDYDALEPFISEKIMRLHHDQHHKSYVDGLNKAEVAIYHGETDNKMWKHWFREQAFHGSGHYLHTIFWFNMTPNGGGEPQANSILAKQINKDFGSFKKFKQIFTKGAESVEGSGWALLVWSPRAQRLGIQTHEKHQHYALADSIPLLVLDVWEHAYYLQYENDRSDYIKAWWNVIDWENVRQRFEAAKQITWRPY
ncbi:superoxide dismutase [Paraliobacillus sediminis]|uniref:superoxide dismutase n=1 Tax=Paraliobacillus sediminis TaxID=1885916 RepID=UPI000E3C9CA5|nr:superoxide dismutase [Paraliobacillus sediminis]